MRQREGGIQVKRSLLLVSGLWFLASGFSHAILDTNENGLSDFWEKQHNSGELFAATFDPQADPDSDGWTNLQEAAAGTNPFNPNPPDGLIAPTTAHIPAVLGEPDGNGVPEIITPEVVTVDWPTLAGKQYTLQFSPDLEVGSWLPVGNPFLASGGEATYGFEISGSDKSFWRVAVEDTDSDSDTLTDYEENLLGTDAYGGTTQPGIPDAWLAANYPDLLLGGGIFSFDPNGDSDGDGISNVEELLGGTDPNTADGAAAQRWLALHGTGEMDVRLTKAHQFTIPAGQTAIVIVAIASDEYPYYTDPSGTGQYNDILEWKIELTEGEDIEGLIDVNSRHYEWETAELLGETLTGLPGPVHYEEVQTLTAPPEEDLTVEVEIAATNIGDGALPSHIAVGILPMEVSWNEFAGYGNVSDHIDPWDPALTNGKRIFPCAKNPDEPAILDKLELLVKTVPSMVGKTVYVKAFDADDTTSEAFDLNITGTSPVIDTNGKAGGDNLDDYKQTPKSGQFWTGSAWGNNESSAVIDANGEAKFTFGVGMQPGNNYRVAVSLDDAAPLIAIQVTDPDAPHHLGSEPNVSAGIIASPLLTVWRRLWVENDSMEAIPTHEFDYKANDLSWDLGENNIVQNVSVNGAGTATSFRIPQISDTSSFGDLEKGEFIVQSVIHPVTGTYFSVSNPSQGTSPIYEVTVAGNHANTPVNSGFRIYDDDSFGLDSPPLPRDDLVNEQMKNYFRPSFVEVTDAIDYNHDKDVPFRINEDVSTNLYGISSTIVADARELTDKPSLWVAPLTAAYQGPEDVDKDPSLGESLRDGETATYGEYDHSTVFVEANRENYENLLRSSNSSMVDIALNSYPKWMVAVASHEIAHQPGEQTEAQDHAEGGLLAEAMNDVLPFEPEKSKFTAATVKRFRYSNRWSK